MSANNAILAFSATVSQAEFQAAYNLIANVLQAAGITKVVDAGQVDVATMNFPGVNNTVAGYEMRQFTDALQATAPVYIKLEPGRGAAATTMCIYITIGTGQDGAGNITGTTLYARDQRLLNGGVTTTIASVVSAGTNRFIWNIPSNVVSIFSLERTRDQTTLLPDARGIRYVTQYNGTWVFKVQLFTGTSPAAEATPPCFPSTVQTTAGEAGTGKVGLLPVHTYEIGRISPPLENIFGIFTTDITPGVPQPATFLGNTITFWPANNTLVGMARSATPAAATVRVATRYD